MTSREKLTGASPPALRAAPRNALRAKHVATGNGNGTGITNGSLGPNLSHSATNSTNSSVSGRGSPREGPSPSPNATTDAPQDMKATESCCMCGETGVTEQLMRCSACASFFHPRCANLPQTPEEGVIFCRWTCFAAHRKAREAVVSTAMQDFPRFSAHLQRLMEDEQQRAAVSAPPPPPPSVPMPTSASLSRRTNNGHADLCEREREPQVTNGGFRRAVSAGAELPARASHSPPQMWTAPDVNVDVDLGLEPAPAMEVDAGMLRSSARLGVDVPPRTAAAAGRGVSMTSHSPYAAQAPRALATIRAELTRSADYVSPALTGASPRIPAQRAAMSASTAASSGLPQLARATTLSRSAPDHRSYKGEPLAAGPVSGHGAPYSAGPSPSIPERRHAGSFSTRAAPRYPGAAPQPYDNINGTRGLAAPPEANVPWLNPAMLPPTLYERFQCAPDNANGVFRVDLTPVFADKTLDVNVREHNFFFRCLESADVSLVIKGMTSDLNPYMWAWPFILESCGNEAHFAFDHFQFRQQPDGPELDYAGELNLSMTTYNTYLEHYLAGSPEILTLEDFVTKKQITIRVAENIIALNSFVIGEHCPQLYTDFTKAFAWDLLAGGIHCLLQYLPSESRPSRFSSPLLHFNFPGARGKLGDPGNGTTDHAYQVMVGALELVIFHRLEPEEHDQFFRVLKRAGYDIEKRAMLLDAHLRCLRDAGFVWSTVVLNAGEFVHVNKGRLHFWRVVEFGNSRTAVTSPCVFLSWEWVFQGITQEGISTECWFAMQSASLITNGWAFDPRRALVEAAKCGVAIVRTGQYVSMLSRPNARPILFELAFLRASATADRQVVAQREDQMVLFLEAILPCLDVLCNEEYHLSRDKDDSAQFRDICDDEAMWTTVDTSLRSPPTTDYRCAICNRELVNIYKQCLGCTMYARRSRPNVDYKIFRICWSCHTQPERHHFKSPQMHGYGDKLCSSEGHTGLLPATRRYQAERSYFKCRCTPYVRCTYCGGCESCCCLCHTLFQTRFRFSSPEHLDQLRAEVADVIKWHTQR